MQHTLGGAIRRNFRGCKSRELAHSLPVKDRPSILPGPYVSTHCSSRRTRHVQLGPLLPLSLALGRIGITHQLGQTLVVIAGCGLVQSWDGPIEEIRPGDVVSITPGEKHWHGAKATTAMTHIAIQERLDGKTADWMEKVSDKQYRGRRGQDTLKRAEPEQIVCGPFLRFRLERIA